ncbi:hypothetical protein RSAG8_12114, partial [Rhizoctonia solani AG-8 WAC10335]
MFAAWIPYETLTLNPSPNATNSGPGKHTPVEYSVFPSTARYEEFEDKASRLHPRTVLNTETEDGGGTLWALSIVKRTVTCSSGSGGSDLTLELPDGEMLSQSFRAPG